MYISTYIMYISLIILVVSKYMCLYIYIIYNAYIASNTSIFHESFGNLIDGVGLKILIHPA